MGGVFFIKVHGIGKPYLWLKLFPPKVQMLLVSFVNPMGTITNSDLELCGNIAHHNIVTSHVNVREHTIWTGSDNVANVYWHRKGSTMTTGPAAYLLCDQALHQQTHQYVLLHNYIPGTANTMADDYSRLWHLTDSQLLRYFNRQYPQRELWQICRLSNKWFFETTLIAVQEAILNSISVKTAKTKDRHWEIWGSFCSDFNIDPFL